jgi:hypothetical protein
MHLLNALLAELYRTPQRFVFFCAFLCTVLPPRYSTTLRILLESKTSAGAPSWHVLAQILQNSGVHLCTGFQNPQRSVTPSWHEASKNPKPEIKEPTDRQNLSVPANAHLTYIYNI